MNKYLSLLIVLALVLVLPGCSNTVSPQEVQVKQQEQSLESAKKLGDVAISAYVGQPYDDRYRLLLSDLVFTQVEPVEVTLASSVLVTIERWIKQAAHNAILLPGCPLYVEPEEGKTAIDYAPVGFVLDVEFQDAVFTEGTAPEITPIDELGVPTAEFTSWFLAKAVSIGLLDSRLEVEGDKVVATLGSEAQGNVSIKVFDTDVKVESSSLVKPINVPELKSFVYFDTGKYKAIYEVKKDTGDSVKVEVSFRHVPVSQGEYQDAESRYLAGIQDMKFKILD